jgi:hypothetical protein
VIYSLIAPAAVVLAEATPGPTPLDFTSYGISGAVIAATIFGWLWPKPAVDRLIASEKAANDRADALASTIRDDVVPILRDVAKATGTGGPLERIAGKVESIERRLDVLEPRRGGSRS